MLDRFIPYSTQSIDNSDKEAVIEALLSTHLTQGNIVCAFEKHIKDFIGTKYAISFNSATSALYAAFHALKTFVLKEKFRDYFSKVDNFDYAKKHNSFSIITTPITFVATTNMMLANGIKPIFTDIDFCGKLKLSNVESLLQKDTIAICSMDYGGSSVDMDAFREFARSHNLIWISDSSHSFGASRDGKKAGSMADMSIFSYHALKSITTCEGGAMVCNEGFFHDIAKLVCSHGIIKKSFYNHDCIDIGFNFRLSEVAAALGISQLKRIDSFIDKRNDIARFYDSAFAKNPYFSIIKREDNEKSTIHLYPILLHREYLCNKDSIIHALHAKNVGAQVHYKPIYNFSYYQQFHHGILRNAEDFYHAQLSIPCHQGMDIQTTQKIADIILSVCKNL